MDHSAADEDPNGGALEVDGGSELERDDQDTGETERVGGFGGERVVRRRSSNMIEIRNLFDSKDADACEFADRLNALRAKAQF